MGLIFAGIAGLGLQGCAGLVSGSGTKSNTPPDTTPPTVSVTSPAAGATLSGTVNLTATASDNVAVAMVQFKVDGANSGSGLSAAPYSYQLDTKTLSDGNHVITAVAGDAAGNTATSASVAVKVNNTVADTTPPTVSLTGPASGATVSATVNVTATASDNVSVASVQFQLDGANVGTADTAAPYSYSWDTTKSANGTHTLTAVAKDGAGNTKTSSAVSVTVNNSTPDTTPPTVSISGPAAGATVSGTVSVTANASDNVGVASVQFQLDGANAGTLDTAAPYSFSWDTTKSSNGAHSLTAIAKDAAGNTKTSAAVSVTVQNATSDTTPPTVSISAPAGGATVSATVSVTANASDNVGVASVQFQLDGANVGSLDTAAPYSFSWDTTKSANGSHALRAIAKDAAGNSTTSAAVTVTVSNAVDTTAPSVPTGLTAAAISSSQITLNWTASTDNVAVTGYRIFRAGAQVGTSTSTSYQDSGLSASTQYSYTVAAFDAAGNVSAQSASASATTQAGTTGGGGGLPTTIGWFQIPGTNYGSLCPSGQNGNCTAVVAAWNSGAGDTKRNRLLFTGGGHSDYSGNEIYALDLNTLKMLRLTNPDSVTNCSETDASGRPNTRHTYGGLAYIPSTDQMFMHAGDLYDSSSGTCTSVATWLLNVASVAATSGNVPQWQHMDPLTGTSVSKDCCNYITAGAYDPNTDAVYYVDDAFLWKYKAQTNTGTKLSSASGLDYHLSAVVDAGHKLFLAFGGGQLWQADLTAATPTLSNIASQTSGCSSLTGAGYSGLAYDPVQNKVIGWVGGGSVIIYDAGTKTCTSQSYPNGPGSAQLNGTLGRWQYFPSLGVFALVNDANQNAWVLRMTPATGGTGGGTSGPAISGVSANSITTTGASIAWSTDVSSTSQVEYGTSTAYGTMTTLNSSMVTAHSVSLTGLTANTAYHYRVRSKNSAGTESISGDFGFATNAVGDTTPPTVSITAPAGGSTLSGTVVVSASASDNVGVAGVQFMVDSVNLGSEVTSSPYSISWDTTAAPNGAHSITARARDAAGNTTVSSAVSVTTSNSSSASNTFQQRCAAAGVIKCVGFDTPADITPFISADSNGVMQASLDTTVSASGGGSLKFVIPANSGQNSSGAWSDSLNGSFGPGTTFFVQFRQRFSPEFVSTKFNGEGWKQSIFHMQGRTCASIELTTVDAFERGQPEMYTNCGATPFEINLNNGDFLLEQGDTSTSGHNCHYQNQTAPSCAKYQPNQWMTFYYEVKVGNWGVGNSSVKAWVAFEGQPLQEFVNIQNLTLDFDLGNGDSFNWITLLPYNTTKPASQTNPVAYTWYDELIVSTQPILAPNGPTPAP